MKRREAAAQEFGWTVSFLVAAGFCAVGALACLLVNPNARLEPERDLMPGA